MRAPQSPDHKSGPRLLDYVDIWMLRVAKMLRKKFENEDQFYDSYFAEGDLEKYRSDVRHAWRYGRLRAVIDELFPVGRARVADIGCGLGIAVQYLPTAVNYTGVELSPASLSMARRTCGGELNATFVKGGFPHLPLESNAFDLVLCMEVVEHVRDDQQALNALCRIVKADGYMLFTVPSTYYWLDYERLLGHFRHYSGSELKAMMEKVGFEVVRQFPQHNDFWRLYHYLYVLVRVLEGVVKRTIRKDFHILNTGAYRVLAGMILKRLAQHEEINDPASTFVLARKRVGAWRR